MYEQVHDPVGGSLGLSTLFAVLPPRTPSSGNMERRRIGDRAIDLRQRPQRAFQQ
jgi:hypothetical protein